MRTHLLKIKQNVVKRAAAYAAYKSTVDELDKQDAESLMGLKGAGVSNASAAGYLGAAQKALNNSKTIHDGLSKATDMHCSVMGKCVDGIGKALNIDVRDRSNANQDEAAGASPTHDGENMEGTPVEHGLKGATARDLQKMSDSLPGRGNAMLKAQVRGALGIGNRNMSADPFGFSKGVHVADHPITGQPVILSEYEKRKLKQ